MKIEVTQQHGRKPRLRIRDASGHLVPLSPGRVFLPRSTPAENRIVREAVDRVLAQRASTSLKA